MLRDQSLIPIAPHVWAGRMPNILPLVPSVGHLLTPTPEEWTIHQEVDQDKNFPAVAYSDRHQPKG